MIYIWLVGFVITLAITIYSQVKVKEVLTFLRVVAMLTFSAAWPLAWILVIVLLVQVVKEEE